MCRLFAVRSPAERPAGAWLVAEANALRVQSRAHPDGWGVASFDSGGLRIERGLAPAHADANFAKAADRAVGRTVVAHVRKASVGRITEPNTHPFVAGRWLFAHNGTLPAFDSKRAALEARLSPRERARLAGETDSERLFGLVLTLLGDDREAGVDALFDAFAKTLRTLDGLYEGERERPSANLLLTDGVRLAVSRKGRPLVLSRRGGEVVVASEPIGDPAGWSEVGEGEIVVVDADSSVHRR